MFFLVDCNRQHGVTSDDVFLVLKDRQWTNYIIFFLSLWKHCSDLIADANDKINALSLVSEQCALLFLPSPFSPPCVFKCLLCSAFLHCVQTWLRTRVRRWTSISTPSPSPFPPPFPSPSNILCKTLQSFPIFGESADQLTSDSTFRWMEDLKREEYYVHLLTVFPNHFFPSATRVKCGICEEREIVSL